MLPELIPWLAVLAFLLGILAFIIEIFVVPGFGVAGVAGIILMGWGILLLSVDITNAFKALVIALILSVVLFFALLKIMSKIKFWQRIKLGDRQYKEAGYAASGEELGQYIGQEGIALTPLRPAGTAEINGQRLDVVSEGGFIALGAKIRVVKVQGSRIIVRSIKNA